MEKEQQNKLIFLSLLVLLLFNFPFVSLAWKPAMLGGVPSVIWFIFTVWVFLIFGVYWLLFKSDK